MINIEKINNIIITEKKKIVPIFSLRINLSFNKITIKISLRINSHINNLNKTKEFITLHIKKISNQIILIMNKKELNLENFNDSYNHFKKGNRNHLIKIIQIKIGKIISNNTNHLI